MKQVLNWKAAPAIFTGANSTYLPSLSSHHQHSLSLLTTTFSVKVPFSIIISTLLQSVITPISILNIGGTQGVKYLDDPMSLF